MEWLFPASSRGPGEGEFEIKNLPTRFSALAVILAAGFFTAAAIAGTTDVDGPTVVRSRAAAITDPGFRLEGPDALGRAGDYILQNNRAAFVIEGLERINSYYYYGGILIDAAPFDGPRQTAPEQFEELGLFVGKLNPRNIMDVTIRAFKGERVEIINDGADGRAAVVRVHGSDEMFWISEMTLMAAAYEAGQGHPRSRPLGLDLYVDYILPPDSPVLRIEFNLKNREPRAQHLFTAAGGFFGDATQNRYYSEGHLEVVFPIDYGLPAVASSSGVYAVALGMPDAVMGTANLSGFDAFFNLRQLFRRINLAPRGWPGDSARVTMFFSVGAGGYNSALAPLNAVNHRPLPGWRINLKPVRGRVTDAKTGAPIPGAEVTISAPNGRGRWRFLDGFHTDSDGRFSGLVPDIGRQLRVTAAVVGRTPPKPVRFRLDDGKPLNLSFAPGGTLAWDIRDSEGRPLPARISLYQGLSETAVRTLYGRNVAGEAPVTPGKYRVAVTRGFEYGIWRGEVEIASGGRAVIRPVLSRMLDTTGFLSTDAHLHAGPSGDNKITIEDRIVTAAVENLEIVIGTDHEAIFPWEPVPAAIGLAEWVAAVTGEEVTATIPEHINAFPFVPRFDLDARGGPVKWHGRDIDQIYADIRERGAQIVQLNHPRGYLAMSEYDPATGTTKMKHPEYVALPPDAEMWSWNFDAIEVMNGYDRALQRGGKGYSLFEYWQSFINHGHRITAMANTDSHDWGIPGSPRNYFSSPTDDPQAFAAEMLVAAVKQGRVLMSGGAFARVSAVGPTGTAGMGDTLAFDGATVELMVHIEAIPEVEVTRIKVFVNCDQVLEVKATDPAGVVKFDGRIPVPVTKDSQVVVMGLGDKPLPEEFIAKSHGGSLRFITNPIYLDLGGDGWTPPGWDGCSYTQ